MRKLNIYRHRDLYFRAASQVFIIGGGGAIDIDLCGITVHQTQSLGVKRQAQAIALAGDAAGSLYARTIIPDPDPEPATLLTDVYVEFSFLAQSGNAVQNGVFYIRLQKQGRYGNGSGIQFFIDLIWFYFVRKYPS